MKKVVLASLLALAVAAPMATITYAQQPAAAAGQIQMSPDEYAAYNNANTQTTPAAKAAAFEAYLKAYPNSAVKADVLSQLLFAYSQTGDATNTLSAADRLLAVDPNNLRALTFEMYYRRQTADANTDPTAKAAALDKVAAYAQTCLNATKPASMTDDDFNKLKAAALPTCNSVIADDDIAKGDFAGAQTALKTELGAASPDDLTKPGAVLQDVYVLAQAYYQQKPPDYLNCAWYATRAAVYAGQYASQIQPLATFCYKKYHGGADGYDKLQAMVKTSLDPPATLSTTITPAPKPEDIVANLIATTPNLSVLAMSDKEFVIQYGRPAVAAQPAADGKPAVEARPADADRVFDTIKGKSTQFPAVTVEDGSTVDKLLVAVTDDAAASKTPDFAFVMKEPLKAVPATGTKIDIEGTYTSYTSSPLLITMSDGAVIEKKKPAAQVHHPVHHTAH